ncbi:MAG: competence protein CoiA family protein [Nostoc sp.]|uniref:competence protein CoiA family protein n=1 Tax=Nostoc sp. TaxID=1180 RepID=UPI002FF5B11C
MLIAITENHIRSKVEKKGQLGKCPKCGNEVIAKCGSVKMWHWAHKAKYDCAWYSAESEWHREWKSLFPASRIEVYINQNRADAIDSTGRVWEFQNSYLKGEEIQEREQAYNNLLWIWHLKGQQKLITFDRYESNNCYEVQWYKIRDSRRYDEGSKKFDSYREADNFCETMKHYGWRVNIHTGQFIDFRDSKKHGVEEVYYEYKQPRWKRVTWYQKIHAFSDNPQIPVWFPESVEGLACRFWWQNSRSMQQCKKRMILDLGNNVFFAVSKIYKDNISTFTDPEYGVRIQEDASFSEGVLFEIKKKELVRCFENPFEPQQLSLL